MLTEDPDEGRPHRLCPRLVRAAAGRPFVRALETGDADLLGVLARHPRSQEVLDVLGPAALVHSVLPVWRAHRLARTDWPLDEQAYALQALMAGFSGPLPLSVDPDKVVAAAVTALLGPEEARPADLRAALEKGLRLLAERRDAVLALVST